MRFNYIGKLIALSIALFFNLPMPGIALVFAIGHIVDIRWYYIKHFLTKNYQVQNSSENFVFICAYFCYCLGLDTRKSVEIFVNGVVSDNKDSIQDLFIYYKDVYIPKKNKKPEILNEQINQTFNMFNQTMEPGDNVTLFNLLENIFDSQKVGANQYEMDFLSQFAQFLKINYVRKTGYTNYYHEEATHAEQNSYKPNNVKTDKSLYIPQDVKDAFVLLGFNAEFPPTLSELKKEYKRLARKYHPDILKGQGAGLKKIEQAEEKLTMLNKSMVLAKNFLAKG